MSAPRDFRALEGRRVGRVDSDSADRCLEGRVERLGCRCASATAVRRHHWRHYFELRQPGAGVRSEPGFSPG
jgi:hypothetical protein